ncbi:hypothetical protein HK100_000717 [Physocladia obscura]|uniref:NADP-dependent oxidoreductase domain-containing protein n=1 Tax=Physocladia obscura TaxID=109957 RepID=A0AAD5SYW2_9FUNG|nr:hypothetical protein HK100_000717 [Physocladia obscura]
MAQTTILGKNGPKVSALGLGVMGMSSVYGKAVDTESLQTLKRSIELGCSFWDTSDVYGLGHNEELIAKAIKEHGRDKIFLCTKFGLTYDRTTGLPGLNSSPEYVKQACDASLARLGIDTIDLYYQHRVDPKTPIEDTVRAMAELVKQGKVRFLGLSEASADTIRRAHKIHPITAYQVEYSPWTTDIESNGILDTCNELGIAVIAYSPLGRGFLTGRYKTPEDFEANDWRRNNPRFQGDAFYKNLEIVTALSNLAAGKGVSPAQLTLAWVIAQGPNIIPIPGTSKIERLEENWGALNVAITEEDNLAIRKIIEDIPVFGDRYHAAGMANLDK